MIVGITAHPLINPEPITLKGIHAYNPRLFRIYTDRTGKEYVFTPTENSVAGSALKTIYQKSHQVGSDKKWMGKVGNPRTIPNDPNSTRTRSRRGINVDTIFEKFAFDLFQELGRGYFEVPKTHLADLPLFNPFTKDHALALTYQGEVGMNHSLRIMSSYIKGYQDLKEAQTLDGDKAIGLMDFIKRYHRPPESILTPKGTLVPLDGMMALLAVGRLLSDVDLLGGRGMNAGFKWIYNEGLIVSARVVKIDPGYAFQFIRDPESQDAGPNWVINTHHGLGSIQYHLEDLKDLQTSTGNRDTRIEFDKLTPTQKDQFFGVLLNTARYLKSDQVLDLLFFREDRFNYSQEAHLPQEFADQTKQEMIDWINWQLEIYQHPLQEFKQRHPEQLLKIRYIDAFGELALPMSNKTYPIRELFSDLALVIPEEKQEQRGMEMGLKSRTKRIRLTELFDDTTRIVLITGEPGTGKSTLCQKIAHDWASGRLFADKFSAVIWIPLRHFNGRDLSQPLHEAIATYVAEVILDAPNLMPFIFATMQQKPVLYVLDGFDEAVDSVRRFFIPLLQDQHVLMTARPETQNLHTTWDRKIENRGFSSEQVKVYIEQFFEGSHALIRKIQSQDILQSLAKNPFYLQMLCHLTKENISVDSLIELYATMIDQIHKWEANRLGKEPNRRLLPLLGRALALAKDLGENLSDQHLEQVSEGYTKEQFIETGLIKKSSIDSTYEVVHASVGEYLIAAWLSESPQEIQTFLSKDDFTEQEQNILRLLCRIEHRKGRALHFFRNLNVTGWKLLLIALACINECKGLREEISSIQHLIESNRDFCQPYNPTEMNLFSALASINEFKGLRREIPYINIKSSYVSNLNFAIKYILRSGWLEALKWINHTNPKCVESFERQYDQATTLHVAAEYGQVEIMQWLCNQDLSLLQKAQMNGFTPLHYAAWNGHIETMQWLYVQVPSLLKKVAKNGCTPLHAAAWNGQVEAMQWLCDQDPQLLQKKDNTGCTPLHYAAHRNHIEAMQWLCDKDPSLLKKADKNGEISLHAAASNGSKMAMQWLYDQDRSFLQRTNNDGRTPLHFAALGGHLWAMQWLCAQDPSLLQKANNDGRTPLHFAALGGHVRAMQWLCEQDPRLLQKANKYGSTPLHAAASGGHVKAMQWLCDQDPSLLQKADKFDVTPLHFATLGGHLNAMQWLREHGCTKEQQSRCIVS